MIYNVPKQLSIMLLGPGKAKDPVFPILPIDKAKATSIKKQDIINRLKYCQYNNSAGTYSEEDFTEVIIDNKNITINLLLPPIIADSYYFRRRNRNEDYFAVRISSPQLPNNGYEYITYVPAYDYVKLIDSVAGNVSDGVLCGSFCVNTVPSVSGCIGCSFVLDDPEDTRLSEAKEASDKLVSSTKTKKWIPGHKYLLPSKDIILYLGVFENSYSRGGSEAMDRIVYDPLDTWGWYGRDNEVLNNHIFIKISSPNTDIPYSPVIRMEKGNNVSDFLRSWLGRKIETYSFEGPEGYGVVSRLRGETRPAVDLGEWLINDGIDIGEVLEDFAMSKLHDSTIPTSDKKKFLPMINKAPKGDDIVRNLVFSGLKGIMSTNAWRERSKKVSGSGCYCFPKFLYGEDEVKNYISKNEKK